MGILKFLRNELTTPWNSILIIATISGIASGSLLVIITFSAEKVANQGEGINVRYLALFTIAFLVFIIGKKYAMINAAVRIESAVKNVRVRVSDKIRKTGLLYFENLDRSYIYTRITQDTNFISVSATIIISACQSAAILVFSLMYIAWLSKMAFLITIGSVFAATLIFFTYRKETKILLEESTQKDTELFENLSHILDGFKELKLNKRKSDDVFEHFTNIADSTEKVKVKTTKCFTRDLVFSQFFFNILIAVIVFVLPTLTTTYSHVVIKTVMAVLFLIGPLELVVSSISVFSMANLAAENLYKLEDELDKARNSEPSYDTVYPIESFQELQLEKVSFKYLDADGREMFSLGPVSLSVKCGEILFIVGGNGSGKSTLLKLLTGLYYPKSGNILLDGSIVNTPVYPGYRELFSAIFADFHLFDRFYGLEDIDEKHVNDLIKTMQLEKKTRYMDGKFSDVNLSTGQRKRLALIMAFLDDKPIYVFDEVAADQDPQFRKYFYEVLLLDLKKQGKTIITATHDDRYFHVADRILKMDYGRIKNYSVE